MGENNGLSDISSGSAGQPGTDAVAAKQEDDDRLPEEYPVKFITSGLLIFSVIALMLIAFLFKDKDADEIQRAFGITLVVLVTALIVVIQRDVSELAPIVGLLGTVIGYLLGKGG